MTKKILIPLVILALILWCLIISGKISSFSTSPISNKGTNREENKYSQILKLTNCKLKASVDDKEVYTIYIVKSGDSLEKIALEQLGDSSNISGLVAINKQVYESLGKSDVLQPGWKLRVPLKEFSSTQSILLGIQGVVFEITPTSIIYGTDKNNTNFYGYIYPNQATNVIGKPNWKNLSPGNCIVAIWDNSKSAPLLIKVQ